MDGTCENRLNMTMNPMNNECELWYTLNPMDNQCHFENTINPMDETCDQSIRITANPMDGGCEIADTMNPMNSDCKDRIPYTLDPMDTECRLKETECPMDKTCQETATTTMNPMDKSCSSIPSADALTSADSNNPQLTRGVQITAGSSKGAFIRFSDQEPYTPFFGPSSQLSTFNVSGKSGVGEPLNLQPSTRFDAPVQLLIPCAGYTDVSGLSVYLNDGSSWIEVGDAAGNVTDKGEGFMVPSSRINMNNGDPSGIIIKIKHFTGVQAAAPQSSSSTNDNSGGDSGGGGCFISQIH